MSSNLMWQPKAPTKGKSLDCQLKFILQERYGLLDGVAVISRDSLDYLTGLADAKVKDADILVKAIEKFGEVEIWLEY